ncbi:MAG TPA: hypothetical protein VJ901_11255 [Thermoanaerobaculia bacterium]|nr:hypothetical protein [Thermoanaerobaculia bacterium]
MLLTFLLATITVVSDSGKPVPNAHVYVYTARPKAGIGAICPSCYKDCGKHGAVDANGRYELPAVDPTLYFNLLAVADGYEPAFANDVDPQSRGVKIALKQRPANVLAVRGTVVDPHGKPVVGAIVAPNALHMSKSSTMFGKLPGVDPLAVTDEKGTFQLVVERADRNVDLKIRARGLAPKIEENVAPGVPAAIRLTNGAAITGRVMANGKPLANVPIGIVQRSHASRTFLGNEEIATGRDGRFLITGIGPNDEYVVYGKMEGLAPSAIVAKPLQVGGDDSRNDIGTLNVEKGHRIRGCVSPPSGVRLPAHTKILLSRIEPWDSQQVEVAEDGSFEFVGVPAETVDLDLRGMSMTVSVDRDLDQLQYTPRPPRRANSSTNASRP